MLCIFSCYVAHGDLHFSLHDALPISKMGLEMVRYNRAYTLSGGERRRLEIARSLVLEPAFILLDRKSTRLNSSHRCISYAVFCLKKKSNTLCKHPLCTPQ